MSSDPLNESACADARENPGAIAFPGAGFGAAERCFNQALHSSPDNLQKLIHLSIGLLHDKDYENAAECALRAADSASSAPAAASAWLSKKLSFTHLRELGEWLGASTSPESPSAAGLPNAMAGNACWDSMAGEGIPPTLVIVGEGSAANQLLFSRYVPRALGRLGRRRGQGGTRVVLCVRPELARLVEGFGIPIITSTFEFRDVVQSSSGRCRWVSLASLPRVLAKWSPPAPVRYRLKREDISRMSELVPSTGALRVGICWRGSQPSRPKSSEINHPLSADLHQMLRVPGCDYYGLQRNAGPGRGPLLNLAAYCHDLADLAAAIHNLDMVVSMNSEVAHLAGALGKPTFLLAESRSDWNWGLDSDRSDWYPALRLFRQADDGTWHSAIEKLIEELTASARAQQSIWTLRLKPTTPTRAGRDRSTTGGQEKVPGSSMVERPAAICRAAGRHGAMSFYETDHWVVAP